MKIKNFENNIFYDFASRITGEDVNLYHHDLEFKRLDNAVKLSYYVGGESADARCFIFTDNACKYKNGNYTGTYDVSRKWIMYLAHEICENNEEANYYIDAYNTRLENKIAQYVQENREQMIT